MNITDWSAGLLAGGFVLSTFLVCVYWHDNNEERRKHEREMKELEDKE